MTLAERLAAAPRLTPAERALAAWVEANAAQLPFETAASLAAATGVSEMTVLRFARRLGYANLREMKEALRPADEGPDGLDPRWRRFRIPSGADAALAESLRLEIAALVRVYELATTPLWREALDVVADARAVNVVGFQASKGLALDFATRLKYARPGVRFCEGVSGTWSEIFGEAEAARCVVLVDTAAYATATFRLCQLCVAEKTPLVVVTDRYADWARGYTRHVLAVTTDVGAFWDSPAPLAALLNLLLNGLAARLGPAAAARVERMRALGARFDAFAYDPPRPARGE